MGKRRTTSKGVGVNIGLFTHNAVWGFSREAAYCIVFCALKCTTEQQTTGEQPIDSGGEVVEVLNSFCYLGDVVSAVGGAGLTVKSRTAAAWRK